MARILRQSTSVDVPIGPFLDSLDGITAETALTITQPDVRLKKNNANWAQKNAAQTLSHEENGFYEVTLDATDTNTVGLLRLAVFESGAAPVWEDFQVLEEVVYDGFYEAAAPGFAGVEIDSPGDIGDIDGLLPLDVKFTSRFNTVPTVLSGSPVVSIYKDNGTTQFTTGVTLATNFDGVTGLNNLNIDPSDVAYSAGSNFQAIITTGTVGGVTAVGLPVASFSIRARSALLPTIAGSTLDVTATGRAGIDLGNVENTGATLTLSATTISGLSTTGIDAILDRPLAESSAVFTWATATLRTIIQWLGVLGKNKITETGTTQLIRNDADNATLGTSTVSDDGTTATRGAIS